MLSLPSERVATCDQDPTSLSDTSVHTLYPSRNTHEVGNHESPHLPSELHKVRMLLAVRAREAALEVPGRRHRLYHGVSIRDGLHRSCTAQCKAWTVLCTAGHAKSAARIVYPRITGCSCRCICGSPAGWLLKLVKYLTTPLGKA